MKSLAETTYGQIPARGDAPVRKRPLEPDAHAHRLVTLADAKVEQPSAQRVYLVPSYRTGGQDAMALEVMAHHLGGGQTSMLYRSLVLEQKVAVAAGAYYMGTSFDDTRFYVWAIPNEGVTLEALDAAIEGVVATVSTTLAEAGDLARAKTRLVADAVYAQDSQATLARWYGAALTTGLTTEDVAGWPDGIDAVTAENVRDAPRPGSRSDVASPGFLLPEVAAEARRRLDRLVARHSAPRRPWCRA